MLFRKLSAKRKTLILCAATFLAAAVLSILLGILYAKYFEGAIWLFAPNAPALTALYAAMAILCLFVILFCALALQKPTLSDTDKAALEARVPSAVLADGEISDSEADAIDGADGADSDEDGADNAISSDECIYESAPEVVLESVTQAVVGIFSVDGNGDDSEENGAVNSENSPSSVRSQGSLTPANPFMYASEPLAVRIIRFFVGAALIPLSVFMLVLYSNGSLKLPLPENLATIALLLPLIFSVYFFPEIIASAVGKRVGSYSIFGIAGIVWLGLTAMTSYMDMTLPVASDHRTLGIISLLALMLFLTADVRARLSEPRPRQSLALNCLALLIALPVSVGRIVAYASEPLALTYDLPVTLICALMSLYAVSRLAFTAFTTES